jgi:hypothetical protein
MREITASIEDAVPSDLFPGVLFSGRDNSGDQQGLCQIRKFCAISDEDGETELPASSPQNIF